jgi:hypothetical protein
MLFYNDNRIILIYLERISGNRVVGRGLDASGSGQGNLRAVITVMNLPVPYNAGNF